MANRHRSDVTLNLDGEAFTLRLTLQTLAEIESELGAGDLQGLGERFASGRVSARDIVVLTGAAIRGGGARLSDEDIARRIRAEDLNRVVEALSTLFTLAFAGPDLNRPAGP
ncbi:Phage tail tube protein, GTA-gp10 [Rhabdaerophilaceae bacterium]